MKVRATEASGRSLAAVSGELQVLLPIGGLVDLEALLGRLEKDIAKADKTIKGLTGRRACRERRRDALDKLIAAHALALVVTLATNNQADFQIYPGLAVENWVA